MSVPFLTLYLHLIAFPRISRENVRESSPIPTGGTPAEVGRHKRGSGSKLKRVMSLPTHSSALSVLIALQFVNVSC